MTFLGLFMSGLSFSPWIVADVRLEQAGYIQPVYGPAFQAKIAGARLETIKGAGHMVNYEKPEAVIAALKGLN